MQIHDIDSFLEYYERVHERTRRLVLLIPPGQLEWTCQEGRFSIGDVVRHIAGIERWLYAETIAGRPLAYTGCGPELAAGFDATLAYFDDMHRQSVEIFKQLSPEMLQERIERPSPMLRWKWLRLLVEHEIHHREQLYVYLSMIGVKTPPIFGLSEPEVVKMRDER